MNKGVTHRSSLAVHYKTHMHVVTCEAHTLVADVSKHMEQPSSDYGVSCRVVWSTPAANPMYVCASMTAPVWPGLLPPLTGW
jgi:hypothetical protein